MDNKSITDNIIRKCSEYCNSDLNNKVYSDAVIRNGLVDLGIKSWGCSNMPSIFQEEIDIKSYKPKENWKVLDVCWFELCAI